MAILEILMPQRYLSVFIVDVNSQQTEKNILPELNTIIHIIIASVLNAVSSLMKVQNKIEDIIKGE